LIFSTFVGLFALLDPDPDSEYGSGSETQIIIIIKGQVGKILNTPGDSNKPFHTVMLKKTNKMWVAKMVARLLATVANTL
jgi:hypothetical protein